MSLARIFRFILVLIALAAALVGAFAWSVLTRPLPLPQSPFEFEVRGGASLGLVARELEAAGALPQAWTLRLLARWRGQDRAIKAGSYEFESGITLPQLLSMLTEGDVTQSAFVIVEGATFADVRKAMRASSALRNTVLDLADADLMAKLGQTARDEAIGFRVVLDDQDAHDASLTGIGGGVSLGNAGGALPAATQRTKQRNLRLCLCQPRLRQR